MDNRRWPQFLIATLLLLSIACAVLAVVAGDRSARHWGPRALGAAADGRVWLTIDDALYIADGAGRLQRRVPLAGLDLPGPVNALVPLPAPDGTVRMLAGVVRLPEWLVLDGAGAVAARLRPRGVEVPWGETFHLAAAPDGRVAMATGGDHRVLLFDAEGAFLAQSVPGLFRYANGLWFEDDRWWVVDTNHGQLRALDGATLEPRAVIGVPAVGAARFPALARRGPGEAVTVVELENDMDHGVVLDVSPAGERQRAYASPVEDSRPRGLLWMDERLLLAEGADHSLHSFDREGRHLGPWGDESLQAALRESRDGHDRWSSALAAGRAGAAGCGLLAIAGYLAWRRRQQTIAPEAAPAGAAMLATPSLGGLPLVFAQLEFQWPLIAGFMVVYALARAALPLAVPLLAAQAGCVAGGWLLSAVGGAMLAFTVALLAVGVLANRYFTRRMAEPRFEALLSSRWVRWFRESRLVADTLEPGESAREVVLVQTSRLFPAFNLQVWVVTNRRLLVFRPEGARGGSLLAALARAGLAARMEAPSRWGAIIDARARLAVEGPDGHAFSGLPGSPVTARRVAALLGLSSRTRHRRAVRAAAAGPQPLAAFALSLAIPGAAQLAQDRFRLGVLLLGIALTTHALVSGPILLGLVGHFYDVPSGVGWPAFTFSAVWALLAALDAGRHARALRSVPARRH